MQKMAQNVSPRYVTIRLTNIGGEMLDDKGQEKMKELEKLAQPLVEWLQANHHPLCTIIITQISAELIEGIIGVPFEPFD